MNKDAVAEMSQQYQVETAQQLVPEGYKQTEVGVIPEDWEVSKFSDLCILVNGRGFKPYEWAVEGLPIIRIQNLNGSEEFNYYSGHYDPKIFIQHGQLLFAWSGSRGTSFGPHIWAGSDALLNYHTWKLLVKEEKVTKSYFFHALKQLTKEIEDSAHGASALVHTQKGEMEQLLVFLPKHQEEQTAIANALSDTDALLSELEKLIAKKQAIKTATMQQLLTGRTRLPQFANHPDGSKKAYKQSELGEIPEDWEVVEFSAVVEKIVGGGTPSRSNPAYWGNDIPWVTVKDFATFSPFTAQEKITKLGLQNSSSNLISSGTLITSTRMALGKAVIYKVDVAINQDLKAIFTSRNLETSFLCFWFENNAQKIEELGSGSTVKGLSLTDLRKIPFLLQSMEEQAAIATILADMDEEIQALEHRLTKTRQIKQGMMQELLTGRTRLL